MNCSDEFINAFHSGTSGCVRECYCGITHFDNEPDDYDWEEGELENLRLLAVNGENCRVSDGSVRTIIIDNKEIVIGCSCNHAARYESFLIDNAVNIAKFLNARAELLRQKAEQISIKNDVMQS